MTEVARFPFVDANPAQPGTSLMPFLPLMLSHDGREAEASGGRRGAAGGSRRGSVKTARPPLCVETTIPDLGRPINRLLHRISWEHKAMASYRNGGQGAEAILTTELVQALDLLPRQLFLAEVVRRCQGGAETARAKLAEEVEEATLLVHPGNTYLRPSWGSHTSSIGVQPDALIESPNVFAFIEAKRPRSGSSFQVEQLAREYLTVRRDAGARHPLLLLLLDREPPVAVRGRGRKGIREAIVDDLPAVLSKFEGSAGDPESVSEGIAETVAWITWPEIRQVIAEQANRLSCEPQSVARAIRRLAAAALDAIDWHSQSAPDHALQQSGTQS